MKRMASTKQQQAQDQQREDEACDKQTNLILIVGLIVVLCVVAFLR